MPAFVRMTDDDMPDLPSNGMPAIDRLGINHYNMNPDRNTSEQVPSSLTAAAMEASTSPVQHPSPEPAVEEERIQLQKIDFNTPVTEVQWSDVPGLQTRLLKAFADDNRLTIGAVYGTTEAELLRMPNFGRRCNAAVNAFFQTRGWYGRGAEPGEIVMVIRLSCAADDEDLYVPTPYKYEPALRMACEVLRGVMDQEGDGHVDVYNDVDATPEAIESAVVMGAEQALDRVLTWMLDDEDQRAAMAETLLRLKERPHGWKSLCELLINGVVRVREG